MIEQLPESSEGILGFKMSGKLHDADYKKSSAILTALEQRLDLIVIAQERDKQIRWPVLKNETQRNITATSSSVARW